MKLIVGLGNPGQAYAKTRHNTGCRALDVLAAKEKWQTAKKLHSLTGTVSLQNETLLLLKPQTFMNESGKAVQAALSFYKLKPTDTLIIYDDIDLPLGQMRLREQGSAGGHNGLASVLDALATTAVSRLKIGIAEQTPGKQKIPSEQYVLNRFSRRGEARLSLALQLIPDIIADWLTGIRTRTYHVDNAKK